ncbi:MAG: SDR family NAD(P)-dependent oxidoreductase [Hyphomicrobiaceae bacterium]
MAGTFDFSGEHALVTGASHGIGLAVAMAFARAGAEVAMLSSTSDIDRAAAEIERETGRRPRPLVCDIADREAVRRAIGQLPRIDVLVNNAGLELMTPIDEPGEEVEKTFDRIIDINVKGTYYVTRDALTVMQDGGRIIITSSVWGKSPAPGFSAYATSKHANIGFMRTLARELGPRGIRVNAICPGWVETRAAMRSMKRIAVAEGRTEDAILSDIVGGQALQGLMQPDDVASLYLYLASPMAANITGQAINVDRGEVMA